MMSKTREDAVWKRVMTMSAETPEPMARSGREASWEGLRAVQVMELLVDERADACTYETLARRAQGTARRCLQQLAQEERRHSRKLETVYYLLTGERPCPDRPKAPCVACLNEELRRRYDAELTGCACYRKVAEHAGSFRCVFLELAAEEECHGRKIMDLLQQCL